MTTNQVWFIVQSDEKPIESEALHNIKESPFPEFFLRFLQHWGYSRISDDKWSYWLGKSNAQFKFYVGETYFRQLKCLDEIANQFGEDLIFFAFSAFDSDFRKESE